MTTKELIKAEIEQLVHWNRDFDRLGALISSGRDWSIIAHNYDSSVLEEEQLNDLYQMIRALVQSKETAAAPSLMSKLQQVKIDAPADFATNFDLYASGEKHVQ